MISVRPDSVLAHCAGSRRVKGALAAAASALTRSATGTAARTDFPELGSQVNTHLSIGLSNATSVTSKLSIVVPESSPFIDSIDGKLTSAANSNSSASGDNQCGQI